jgi:TolC family type I secretion outer membrane protein
MTKPMQYLMPVLALCLALSAVGAEAQEGTGRRLSLQEAMDTALKQNPQVTQYRELMVAAKEGIGISRSAYFPQLSLRGDFYYGTAFSSSSAGATFQGGTVPGTSRPLSLTNNPRDFYIYRFSLNQLIYDFGKTSGTVEQSTASYKASQEDYAASRQQVILDTRTAYFNYLAARRAVKVEEQNVRQNQELLKQAQGFYQVGLRAKIDVTKAEANLYQAESNLIRAKNAAEVGRVDLMKALGLKSWPYADVEDILEVSPRPVVLEDLKAQALRQRPEIQRNRAQQQRDQAAIQVAQAGYFPTLSSNSAYGWQGSGYPLDDNWWLGMGVSFPLFEGGRTLYSVRQAKAQFRSTLANADVLTLDVLKEVEQSYLDLKAAWEVIRSTKKAREAAEENLRLAWGRYRAGVGNIIEVTDAQTQFARADLEYVRALLEYRIVEARLDKAIGKTF